GESDRFRDEIPDGFDRVFLARRLRGELVSFVGGFRTLAGTVEKGIVEIGQVFLQISGEVLDAGHVKPFGRELPFKRQSLDVMGLPLKDLGAADGICLLLYNSIRSGDESLDGDIGRGG